MKVIRRLPLMSHSANYFFTLHKNKAIFNIPFNMYEVDKSPFKIRDIQSIQIINNSLEIVFNIPEGNVLKNNSIRDIE